MINSIEPSVAIKIRRNLQVDICKSTDLVAQQVEHYTYEFSIISKKIVGWYDWDGKGIYAVALVHLSSILN